MSGTFEIFGLRPSRHRLPGRELQRVFQRSVRAGKAFRCQRRQALAANLRAAEES
jgi:hypothetical protein